MADNQEGLNSDSTVDTDTPDEPTGNKNGVPTDDSTDNDDNTSASADNTPDEGESGEKKFSQADLNRFLADEKRKLKRQQQLDEQRKKGEFESLYKDEESAHLETKRELWKLRAALEYELDSEWADMISGDSEESIKESAKSLKTRLDKLAKKETPRGPGTPRHQRADDEGKGTKDGAKKTAEAVDSLFGIKRH